MSRLTEEPNIVKFVRSDAIQYEHEWNPRDYNPYHARQVLLDHIDEAVEAEALGWDGYFVTEHHFDGWTLAPQPNLFLAAVAMRTSRIRLGHSVQVLPVHNPLHLAEQYGMLDVLSGGRLEVGLGRGNFRFEWERYAEAQEDAPALFDEKYKLLMKALTQAEFTHDAVVPVAKPSTIYPRPMQNPLPTWLAAVSPGSVERVGRLGANLSSPAIPDGGEKLERYIEAAGQAGWTVTGANYMVLTRIICAPTDREAHLIDEQNTRVMLDALGTRGVTRDTPAGALQVAGFTQGIVGSPQTVREQLAEVLRSTGARRVLAIIRLRGMPGEVSRQTQHLMATDVIPHLRNLAVPGSSKHNGRASDVSRLGARDGESVPAREMVK
ncbi:LLM class flavin-dependent oxidoreductase [Streptomyces sp. NPDC048430]|uniref:LLM class flavin-dependent oxidoreductase n=1 Tax=Streptomyces sp. NPDC048430 TaxID=3155388 RepID=UPI00342CE5C0